MNRRSFITGIATLIGGAALDPERLPWVPGKKLISIPKSRNVFIPYMTVSQEMVVMLKNGALDGLFNPKQDLYRLWRQSRVDNIRQPHIHPENGAKQRNRERLRMYDTLNQRDT